MESERKILSFIYESSLTGEEETMNLLKLIINKGNKIKADINNLNQDYRDFAQNAQQLLLGVNPKPKKPNSLCSLGKRLKTSFKIMNDNSDAKIADTIIQSLQKKEIEIQKNIDYYIETIDEKTEFFANEYKDFHSKAIVKLKDFL